jgi:gluconolactonase
MNNFAIKSYSDSFNDLIDSGEQIEVISSGHQFTEGPVWDDNRNCLFFSDIPANTIFKWTTIDGTQSFQSPSYFANGLALDNKSNLIICEHQGRCISSLNENMDRTILADSFNGLKLNSPNDLVVADDGSIIFTDPIYGLREGNGGPAQQELPFQGVFRYDPKINNLTLVTDSFERPNGLAISPDQKYLFVVDTVKQHIRKFNIDHEWKIVGGNIWVELWDSEQTGRPDGIKFDQNGNLFSTGPGGIWVFSSNAELIGRIFLPDKTSNLAWGMQDRKSLFITSSDKVYRLRCKTRGFS